MSEGWGIPEWLPPAVRRSIAKEELAAQRETRQADAERERRDEERHNRALAAYREQAEQRGQVVDVMALARGEVRGRSVQDVFADALAASARDDARDAHRVHRDGTGPPEILHVEFAEPNIIAPSARSERGLVAFNRYRRWKDAHDARRRAEAAEEASQLDWGIIDGVTARTSPVAVLTAADGPLGGA
jgi:hypothetical protein